MITKLEFFAPYPELQKMAIEALNQHSTQEKLQYNSTVIAVNNTDQIPPTLQCDVVIARGYTAQRIKSLMPYMPCVEIPITIYDVSRALAKCRRMFPQQKIGLVGRYDAIQFLMEFFREKRWDILFYYPEQMDDLESAIDRALSDGCQVLVGGYSLNLIASRRRVPSVLISAGREAVEQAIDEAIKLVHVIRQEREKNELFKITLQLSEDGIVYVDNNGRITIANERAKRLAKTPEDLLEQQVQQALPFLSSYWQAVLQSLKQVTNDICKNGNEVFSVNCYPVSVENQAAGVLFFFRNVTDVMRQQKVLHKKLFEQGLTARYSFEHILYASPRMEQTVALARSYAKVNSNVLIQGETGTGKELLAQSIHSDSERFMGPFVAINCSTFTENLLESELFGYSEGTFTGGLRGGKIGLFELADGGTLFLDEVSEIPLNFQGKLLRVLQEREVRRLGDNRIRKIDVRIISATNRDLLELSLQGGFRKDLLYRLEVLKLTVPPLRERQEDIPLLLSNFIEHYRKQCHSRVQQFSPEAVKLLQRHPFYGNVRELGNLVERLLVIYSAKEVITGEDLQAALELPAGPPASPPPASPATDEKARLEEVLASCRYNKTLAAKQLGVSRSTLWRKLKLHGLT